ncbi:transcriptional activator NhaR [Undibacterium squillarum]|uniref:transcriptional activator NhaR n=1 Tax=Undibacterium squillarum TaxID=1131567 RepID=UPI0035B1A947
MASLNYKHLRYYWMVAKTGSIAKAAEQLHLTPHAVSGQIKEFEQQLGVELFKKSGRNLSLTEAGQRIMVYADDIFTTGDQLLDVLRNQMQARRRPFRVGIADSVPKVVAYKLLEPALQISDPVSLHCREGRLELLLADLALHKLDAVIADRPLSSVSNQISVRAFSHLLGKSGLTVFAEAGLAKQYPGKYPACLKGAPFLIPGEDAAVHSKILRWMSDQQLQAVIIGEFDDGALMKAFGRAGTGFFFAPTAVKQDVISQYGVKAVFDIPDLTEEIYVLTTERRLQDPAVMAISKHAQQDTFA